LIAYILLCVISSMWRLIYTPNFSVFFFFDFTIRSRNHDSDFLPKNITYYQYSTNYSFLATIPIFYTFRLRRTPSLRLSAMFRLIALQIDTSKRCNYRLIDSSELRISKADTIDIL